jgi:MATE family multidrug resistance protein
VVAGLGTSSLAAFMAVLQINSVSFQPGFALASAGAILVGQAIGADRKDDVPALVGLTVRVAAGWQGIVSSFYLAIPSVLLLPFADDRAGAAAFLAVGAQMLRWSAAWQLVDGLSMTFSESLRAAGDTAFPMWARIVIAWGLFTPGAWITVRWLGAGERGVVLWIVAYLGLLALVLWWRFRSGAWRHIELVSPGG